MRTLKKYLPWLAVLVVALSIYTPVWLSEHTKIIISIPGNYDDVFLPNVAIVHNVWFLASIAFTSFLFGVYTPESFTGWKGVARGFSDVLGITSLVALFYPHLPAIITSVIAVIGVRIIFAIIPPGRVKIKNWPKFGDCVEVKVDKVTKTGIVQATYQAQNGNDDMLRVYYPLDRTSHVVDPEAVKDGKISIKAIPDEKAGFRADIHRPSNCEQS